MKCFFNFLIIYAAFSFCQPGFAQSTCSDLFKLESTSPFNTELQKIISQSGEAREQSQIKLLREIQTSISQALGFETKLRFEVQDEFINIFSLNRNQVKVIELTLMYLPTRKMLIVEYIGTAPYSKLGLGQKLIEAALVRFPEVSFLKADSLVSDNEAVLNNYLSQGDSIEVALKKTPMFKIFTKLGFSELVQSSINPEYGFTAQRPK
jgi:hypothetical protein